MSEPEFSRPARRAAREPAWAREPWAREPTGPALFLSRRQGGRGPSTPSPSAAPVSVDDNRPTPLVVCRAGRTERAKDAVSGPKTAGTLSPHAKERSLSRGRVAPQPLHSLSLRLRPLSLTLQVQFLCYAFGGKDQYLGKSIAEAHAHLITSRGVNRSHFRRVAALLQAALERIDVPPALVAECIANVAPAASVFPEVGEPPVVGPEPAPAKGTPAALAAEKAAGAPGEGSPGEAA